MGCGKTISVLTALDLLYLSGAITRPTLILAPKRVVESVWAQEAEKWGMSHLIASRVTGTAKQREAALARQSLVYACSYDNLPWLVKTLGAAWMFDVVVADELTRLKSFRLRGGGKRAYALAKPSMRATRFIGLTGTPTPNGLLDLWGQVWFLDRGERLGKTFTAFRLRWFREVPTGGPYQRLEPAPCAQAEIQARISDLCLSIRTEDWFDLDDPISVPVKVDLPPKAAKVYKAMEKEMFAELDGGIEVEAFNAASKSIKCLQIASGSLITGDGHEVLHDAKIEALRSIVEEAAGAPLLVAYHFKADLARLKKAFPRSEELTEGNLPRWNRGEIPMLLAHPQSAGHGLNLQDGGDRVVFFSHWWALEARQQIIERIGPVRQAQSGHPRPVYVYDIIAKGTVDELVIARHKTKCAVQDILLEALRSRSVHA
jgi:SNF2 family DNA or RNA helicase